LFYQNAPVTFTLDTMKIPALRVEVNGEVIAIAGAEGLSLLTGQVGFGAGPNRAIDVSEVMFSVMGLAAQGPQPRQLAWGKDIQLKLGDRVTFQFVEVEQPSPPAEALRTPSSAELAAASAERRQIQGDVRQVLGRSGEELST
jgi:hypothetical protein